MKINKGFYAHTIKYLDSLQILKKNCKFSKDYFMVSTSGFPSLHITPSSSKVTHEISQICQASFPGSIFQYYNTIEEHVTAYSIIP